MGTILISQAIILTAADHRYFRTVWQLLKSFERHRPSVPIDWILHDLGLHQEDLNELKASFPWCTIKTFDYAAYPKHVRLENGNYAWKPIIIAAELSKTDVPLLWFDAGTVLSRHWSQAIDLTLEKGFWILRSQTPLHLKCENRVLTELSVPIEAWHMPEYAAGALGIDPHNSALRQIIEQWKDQALIEARIQPGGSVVDHKHDQALLNCLIYKAAFAGEIELPCEEIDISSSQPTSLISTRNFVANSVSFKLDFLVRGWFRIAKLADRQYLKWSGRADRFFGGLARFIKEEFQVALHNRDTGDHQAVRSPAYSYLADPFLVQAPTGHVLFAEEFRYLFDLGRLVVLHHDAAMRVTKFEALSFVGPFSQINCHASFPHVFKIDGSFHMVPETCGRLSVDLYQCKAWPNQWQICRRLLFDIDAADTMLIFRDEKWWLFTSVRGERPQRHLEIYYSDNLFNGAFLPHPINRKKLYADRKHGTGRNAGRLEVNAKGTIYRLMQSSDRYYGQGSQLMEIVRLTETEFEEVPVGEVSDTETELTTEKWHHCSSAGPWIAFDERTRAR